MKIIYSLAVLCIGFISCNSSSKKNQQIPAITNKGIAVILNEDGTWSYADKTNLADKGKIKSTDSILNLLASSDNNNIFLVKSEVANVTVKVNTEKWRFKKTDGSEASEYTFDLKRDGAYAYLITERAELPLLTLKKIALENARNAAPDIKLIDEEYRTVNGVKVLFMKMEGTVETLKLTYLGYYYSSKKGTIQFITSTTQNLLEENRSNMEELLNGMVITAEE
jgi:hypothetical protein